MTGWSLGGVAANADGGFGRMREMLAETCGLDPVTIKAFAAFGMLLNNGAAIQVAETRRAVGARLRTCIGPDLFDHITIGTAR